VGEEGPELVYFNGGERVLNAAQTSTMQTKAAPTVSALPMPPSGGGGSSPPVQITFQIQGNATQETVQDLREFADEIVERVTDSLADRDADRQRRLMI
jgi:hypothetical protein